MAGNFLLPAFVPGLLLPWIEHCPPSCLLRRRAVPSPPPPPHAWHTHTLGRPAPPAAPRRCPTAQLAAECLALEAQAQWALRFGGQHCDDITVAVAFLPDHGAC